MLVKPIWYYKTLQQKWLMKEFQLVKKPFDLKLTDGEFKKEDVLILPGVKLQTVSRSKRALFDYCYSTSNNYPNSFGLGPQNGNTYTTVTTCIPVGLAVASSAAFLFVFVGAALLLYRPGVNSTKHLYTCKADLILMPAIRFLKP